MTNDKMANFWIFVPTRKSASAQKMNWTTCKKWLSALAFLPLFAQAQTAVRLDDLSFWKPTGQSNWQIAGDAAADLAKPEKMTAAKGMGVLVNLPDSKNRANLLSANEFGDVNVSFDFMMAAHSNSGFYLQGRYEVQLLDSWGVQHPTYGDCGGIYARRRWNPNEQMFDGHAPRQNACLAPGLWQHLDISFQAPRFDAAGKKTANARLLKVVLNGALLHENLELTGPTGGPISEQEATKGPFMIQGDHGPVAFRNFQVSNLDGQPVTAAGPFSYKVIYGDYRNLADFAGKKVELEGKTQQLTWEVAKKESSFATTFSGALNIPQAGKHRFTMQAGGKNYLKINGLEILPDQWTYAGNQRTAEIELPAGTVPLELCNYKMDGWMPPYLALWAEGPTSPPAALHTLSSTLALAAPDPIYLYTAEPKVFRSFMDITLPNAQRGEQDFMGYKDQNRKRVVHAVQVGDPTRLHYTYDLDNGAVAQMWKGEFLHTSPMWDDRGDGSSRPRGALLPFDDVQPVVEKSKLFDLTTSQNDPAPGFRPRGYDLDEAGRPTFRYALAGMEVEDQLRAADGKTLNRTLVFNNLPSGNNYVVRLAIGKTIEKVDDDTYAVDGRRYYVRVAKGEKATLETSAGLTVLYVPVAAKVEYTWAW
jgi:hypothetical protein